MVGMGRLYRLPGSGGNVVAASDTGVPRGLAMGWEGLHSVLPADVGIAPCVPAETGLCGVPWHGWSVVRQTWESEDPDENVASVSAIKFYRDRLTVRRACLGIDGCRGGIRA